MTSINCKVIGMLAALVGGLLFSKLGYYCVLLWVSAALAFFLVSTILLQIQDAGYILFSIQLIFYTLSFYISNCRNGLYLYSGMNISSQLVSVSTW